jgi:peptide/nickel transport system substrate-binding protein
MCSGSTSNPAPIQRPENHSSNRGAPRFSTTSASARALLHAVDKPSIIATELRGLAVKRLEPRVAANAYWHNPDVAKYEFDPDRANALLDEIGLKDTNRDGIREDANGNKVSFTFVTNKGNKTRENIATLLAQDWAAVGVEARPQYVDFNTLVTMTADTFEYDACLLGFGGSIHPSTAMNLYRSSGRTHFWNPQQEKPATPWEAEIDRLADAFNATLDIKQQRRDFFRIRKSLPSSAPSCRCSHPRCSSWPATSSAT